MGNSRNKVIFLDIDGVLNSAQWLTQIKGEGRDEKMFDPSAVKTFNKITDETGAKIVVSSSWRKSKTLEELRDLFKRVGITGEVIGKTPVAKVIDGSFVPRGLEIHMWMTSNGIKPHLFKSYVIIDDDSDMLYNQRKNFFNTDWDFGLGPSMGYRITNFLNSK